MKNNFDNLTQTSIKKEKINLFVIKRSETNKVFSFSRAPDSHQGIGIRLEEASKTSGKDRISLLAQIKAFLIMELLFFLKHEENLEI